MPENASWPPRHVLCVGGVVVHRKRVLLVRQASGTSLEGQWSVPWGIVEAGEAPHEAIVRETLEEAGVTASVVGLLGTQNVNWQSALALVYYLTHEDGEPGGDGQETDAARYFTVDELLALDEPIERWSKWLVCFKSKYLGLKAKNLSCRIITSCSCLIP